MKKFLFTILLLLVLHLYGSAQVTVVNKKGTVTEIDSSKWTLTGSNIFNKNSGNVGVGNPTPTYKLDVTGKQRISDSLVTNTARVITLNSGTTNDSIVVSDASTGVLKRVAPIRLNKVDSTTANNGLTLTGKNVALGGSLTAATTTITTTATNTLSVAGLQSGDGNDSLVAADPTSGELKRVEQRKKPTVIKTTATQATSSTTGVNVNVLTFNTVANKNYRVRLWLVYNASTAAIGLRLGPNTFSGGNMWYSTFIFTSTTANISFAGFNTSGLLSSTSSRATSDNVAIIEMDIEATSVATVSFQFGSELTTGTITIQAGSRLEYEITN